MNRRDFNRVLLGGGTGLLMSCQSESGGDLIDAHAHLWPSFGEYPFRQGIGREDLKPAHFTARELTSEGLACGVKRFVLIQHIFYHGYDYSYLKNISQKHPGTFAVVGALDKNDPYLEIKMKADAGTDVAGYRIPSKDGEAWLSGKEMDRLWSLAADYNQSICLLRNRNVSLKSVYLKCKENENTRVVIDHYGHVDFKNKTEVDYLWRLSQMKNVYLKVSKYYGNGAMTPPYLDMLPLFKEVLSHFGSEKLMWGSDCPYQLDGVHTYRAAFDILDKYADFLTHEDKQNIFQNTAAKIFFKS